MAHIVHGDTLCQCNAVQRCQHFTDPDGIACGFHVAAIRSGLGHLSRQGGGSHLAAGHAVNGVVDKDHGDVLAAGSCMDGFCCTDCRQIAVALIGEHHVFGNRPFQSGCNCRSTAVGSLHHVTAKIIITHNGTTHRSHTDCPAFYAQLIDGLCHQTVNNAVGASRTVMHGDVRDGLRLLKYDAHYRSPPRIFSICSSTSPGVGIMPPVRP